MPQAGQPSSAEPPTTRLSIAAKNAAKAVINNAAAVTHRNQPAAPARTDREIESWLGELRGTPGHAQPPAGPPPRDESTEPTTALPVQRQEPRPAKRQPKPKPPPRPAADAESTEKLPRQGQPSTEDEPRRGGGLSAQDLLRREGRL
jgi:RND superfamily putative drug exporter